MTETQVITIITALAPIYPFLFALAAALFQWLITKLPKNRQTEVNQVVQTVVQGVEQCGAGKTGAEKKQMAVSMINTILNSLHVAVSPTLVDALIEAAVYGLNQNQGISLPTIAVNQGMQTGYALNAVPANG